MTPLQLARHVERHVRRRPIARVVFCLLLATAVSALLWFLVGVVLEEHGGHGGLL